MSLVVSICKFIKKVVQFTLLRIVIILLVFQAQGFFSNIKSQIWVEDSFEDFIDGKLDASGNNIYVSKDGKIRTINRFDYNNDGYIDLLFPQTHDIFSDVPPTLVEVLNNRTVKERSLALEGTLQAVASDLNQDGFQDLVFCPSSNGIQNPRSFITIIYGGDDGWPSYRTTSALPVNNIQSIAIADLNHDGWDDIVTLNGEGWIFGQPEGNIIRIFWGGERGYLNTRHHDFGIIEPVGVTSGDFDNDGFADLAVLKKDNKISIYWEISPVKDSKNAVVQSDIKFSGPTGTLIAAGDIDNDKVTDLLVGTIEEVLCLLPSKINRSFGETQNIKCFNASSIVVDDMDKDGLNDILLAFFAMKRASGGELAGADETSGNSLQILWGDNNGFSHLKSSELAAPSLTASATGDFDGDGKKDIAIAINKSQENFKTNSIIYYGKGNRQFEKGKVGITTYGANDVITIPEINSNKKQIIFCNSTGGTIGEMVPAYLYWGGPNGFSEKRRTDIPFRSGYECSAADLNADGYSDIVIMNEMHGGQGLEEDPLAGANIFWGSPEGFDFGIKARSILTESYLGSSNIADINKDGYLDIILGQYTVPGYTTNIIIYYGNKDGYSQEKRTTIPCSGRSLSVQLADYDKNGWLDIAVNSYTEVGIRIFYGDEMGFDFNNRVELDAPAVCDNETADLNGDGWLDIIATCYNDISDNGHHDMGLFIFWGAPGGFNHANAQWLPGNTVLGPVVADFDSDGYLDLFCPDYHNDLSREHESCFLYWGSKDGYSLENKTVLTNDSGSHGFAADFDKDGKLDLAVSNHTVHGNHAAYSKVYYNDGNRFNNPRIEKLPTIGPHWSHNEDMGHIYNRAWQQTYESSVFRVSKNRTTGKISSDADIFEGTSLVFEVRSSILEKDLSSKKWDRISDMGNFKIGSKDKFLQYKAILISDNGDRFPILDKVIVEVR